MKTASIVLGVIVGVALLGGLWVMGTYNALATQDQVVENSWATVEADYQRRFDLIPNLVGSVQGILRQEQKVFGDIAEARTRYANAKSGGSQEEQVAAYGQYESVVGRLLVVMENYPELKSYAQVQALMDELAGTENRVLVSRGRYNEQVRLWNTQMVRFPRSLLAGMFGFEKREFFQAETGSEKAPEVKLNEGI